MDTAIYFWKNVSTHYYILSFKLFNILHLIGVIVKYTDLS